jgi:hypothetical protein
MKRVQKKHPSKYIVCISVVVGSVGDAWFDMGYIEDGDVTYGVEFDNGGCIMEDTIIVFQKLCIPCRDFINYTRSHLGC